jgi:segregation and condensation protein B
MTLDAQIEAILFWKAEPVSVKKLASILEKNEAEIREAVAILRTNVLANRGLTLIELEDEVTLGTAKDLSFLIEKLTKEELMKDLGKAGLETLSIILYQGPIPRAEIDYIRGVNSQFILRNMLIRGLIEKVENPADRRSFLYKPTMELLAHLGLSAVSSLPDYETVRKNIETFKAAEIVAEAAASIEEEKAVHGKLAEDKSESDKN